MRCSKLYSVRTTELNARDQVGVLRGCAKHIARGTAWWKHVEEKMPAQRLAEFVAILYPTLIQTPLAELRISKLQGRAAFSLRDDCGSK
jgi:hypothetical protein